MIDVHVHIVPGIDDGPAGLDGALAMCRAAAADGVEALIATPHQRHPAWPNEDRGGIRQRFAELEQAVGPTPRLFLGAELYVDSELLDDLDLLPGGSVLTLAGSRYVLLEFPTSGLGPDPRAIVHEVVVAGRVPVLAHPERLPFFAERPETLAELVSLGARLQITAGSVTGVFGPWAERCCRFLLDNDLAHFMASDGHDLQVRPPLLSVAAERVAAGWGEATARRLTLDNPRALVQDAEVG